MTEVRGLRGERSGVEPDETRDAGFEPHKKIELGVRGLSDFFGQRLT